MAAKENLSLHQRILTDIAGRILSGEWPPGYRIPFEHELMAQYRCSRMTVSKVLTHLANADMIERRRKAGSFVARPHSQSAVLEIPDLKAEVTALGLPYSFDMLVRRKRKSNQADRATLDLKTAVPVLELVCCHYAGQQPFCFEERLINLVAVPGAADETFADLAPGAWLMSRVPWTAAEHRIRAAEASSSAAAVLKLTGAKPCLVIERRTWIADHTVTFVRLTYPGPVHELIARFTPHKGEDRLRKPQALRTLDLQVANSNSDGSNNEAATSASATRDLASSATRDSASSAPPTSAASAASGRKTGRTGAVRPRE